MSRTPRTPAALRRDVERHLAPGRSRVPWRAVLALGLVLGFGLWAGWLVQTVGHERTLVEERVGWLIQARTVEEYVESGAPAASPAIQALRDELRLAKAPATLVTPLDDALAASGDGEREAAEAAMGRFIGAVRAENGRLSAQLGSRWNALSLVVVIALLFGGLMVLFLYLEQRRAAELARWQAALEAALVEVDAAREAAESADRLKTRMLANMSHEIRSPMTAVLGMLQLTADLVDGRAAEQLAVAERAAGYLVRLIDDLLDLSRLQAGGVQLSEEPVAIRTLLHDVVRLHEGREEAAELRFSVEIDDALPAVIRGDPVRLRQLVDGFVANAIRYAPHGEVWVRARRVAHGRIRLEVQDQGPGIAEEEQARIFQPFIQGSGRPDASVGTGLGLAIAREVVHAMGGHIGVDSRPGGGATFWVELPGAGGTVTPEVREHAAPRPERLGGPVLVVDDDAVIRRVVRALLERLGHEVVEASGGAEGVETWRSTHPAAIFMDWQMPGVDGLEATRRIRALEEGTRVPIVAMTARNLVGDRAEIVAAGLDDHLTKPVSQRALAEVLERWVGQPSSGDACERQGRLLDLDGLADNLGSAELVDHVLALWLADPANQDAALDDPATRAAVVHRLKGSSASIGATRLAESCGALLDALDADGGAPPLLARVRGDLADTREAVGRAVAAD